MLSPREIVEIIEFLRTALWKLAESGSDVSAAVGIAERFDVLREEFRKQRDRFAADVDELASLSRRFQFILNERLSQVVDRFHRVNEEISRGEREKAFLRGTLIRIAGESGQRQLMGTKAQVRVREISARQLPLPRSSERLQLEEVLRTAGAWDHVSQLSRPRLEQAIAGKRIPENLQPQLDALCPVKVSHQLTCTVLTPQVPEKGPAA